LSLWRAEVVFRVVTLVICLFLIVKWQPIYRHAGVALAVGAAMIVVTAGGSWLALRARAHNVPFVLADVIVTAGLTALTAGAQTPIQLHGQMLTLTTIWAAGPTIEAAFVLGPVGGLFAAAVQFVVSALLAQTWQGRTLNSAVLLLIVGAVVGFVARVAVRAENELRSAASLQAAVAERERLARPIHDGVLQLLALVSRTGRDADDPWGTLAQAAGEQEAALRSLLTTSTPTVIDLARRDLGEDLRALRSPRVTVSTPAERVQLPAQQATEVSHAVRAALANVATHAGDGAHAWVLLESGTDDVRITVRDDGVGMPAGRLDDAEREGRLGIAQSVRGRIRELGGTCTVTSAPGEGTSFEIVVPR